MPEVTSDETVVEIDDTESLKSTEEICNQEECFLFKSIQKPLIHQAYYSEKGKFNLILKSTFHLIFGWRYLFLLDMSDLFLTPFWNTQYTSAWNTDAHLPRDTDTLFPLLVDTSPGPGIHLWAFREPDLTHF